MPSSGVRCRTNGPPHPPITQPDIQLVTLMDVSLAALPQAVSSWYVVAAPHHRASAFGLACAMSALLNFWATQSGHRPLVLMVCKCHLSPEQFQPV